MAHGKPPRPSAETTSPSSAHHESGDAPLASRPLPLPLGYYELYGIAPPKSVQARHPTFPYGLLAYHDAAGRNPTAPAATTIQQKAAVQARSIEPESLDDSPAVHQAAQQGISGMSGPLPHLQHIQQSFGHHDLSGVKAHTDASAQTGARAMGAEAFTTGNHVAFAGTASLHTAAHEAAHVIQQRAGVQLKGGVGEVGDAYERNADAVADRVVAGQSAEALLDEAVGLKPGGTKREPRGPERLTLEEFARRDAAWRAMGGEATARTALPTANVQGKAHQGPERLTLQELAQRDAARRTAGGGKDSTANSKDHDEHASGGSSTADVQGKFPEKRAVQRSVLTNIKDGYRHVKDLVNAVRLSGHYIPKAVRSQVHIVDELLSAIVGLCISLGVAGLVLALTTAGGAAMGAFIGEGIGAVPGAEFGYMLGLELLNYWGVMFLTAFGIDLANQLGIALHRFIIAAWNADGDDKAIDRAARACADAVGVASKCVVEGLILAAQVRGVPWVVGKLGASRFGRLIGTDRLARWLKREVQTRNGSVAKTEPPHGRTEDTHQMAPANISGGASSPEIQSPSVKNTPTHHTSSPSLIQGLGNIGSHGPMTAGNALKSGSQWLGKGYREIGPKGSGVYRSADGLRQFRMTAGDLDPLGHGANSGLGSHVHFEALDSAGRIIENLHIPLEQ